MLIGCERGSTKDQCLVSTQMGKHIPILFKFQIRISICFFARCENKQSLLVFTLSIQRHQEFKLFCCWGFQVFGSRVE